MKIKCPACDFENEDDSKFCKNCNGPLHLHSFCPYCGYLLRNEPNRKKECLNCGKYIYVQNGKLITEEEENIYRNQENTNSRNSRKETEGQKYRRLYAELDKLFQNPNTSFDLIKKYTKITNNIEKNFSNRNLKGIKLEKKGKIDEAIELYEKNINEEFYGSHPYERLAIIYRKKGLFDDEIRVLRKAKGRMNEEKLKRRLEKVKKIIKKTKNIL